MSLKDQLTGTGIAVVTPFKDNGKIDFHALDKIVEFQIQGGADYLVFLGTTGESVTLRKEEKKDIIHFAYEKTKNKIPVVIGVGGSNTADVMKDLKLLPLDNAIAILTVCPYYNKPSQEGIFKHYKALAQVSPKPILLYNVPGRTGVNMTSQTVIKIAQEINNICGIKEASGNLPQCITILNNVRKDFAVITGDDHLVLPSIACGMDGVISVVANAFPSEMSKLVNYCLENKFEKARKIQKTIYEACDLCFVENNPAGIKAFMYELDLCDNVVRMPLSPISAVHHDKIKAFVKNYGQTK